MVDSATVALAGTVLAASLLGSAHCAGMCGGIALVAIGTDRRARIVRQVGYHAGRLISYSVVGIAAGICGAVVDDAGVLIGAQRVAAIAAGTAIAVIGLVAVARALGARMPRFNIVGDATPRQSNLGLALPIADGRGRDGTRNEASIIAAPRALVLLAQRVHSHTLRLPPAWRGVPLGLATPLLPCGWLYAFAAIAAGSASPLLGALVMVAFWLGTVPAVVIASNGARFMFARLGRAAPIVAGIAMFAIGTQVAWTRGSIATAAMHEAMTLRSQQSNATVAQLKSSVDAVANEVPACCREAP
ncbi:MAG: sulfite exporter TauE/SafE family protein [Planctomycetota bacterium]|nr:MAG: sulfite exporter TauE/SafE family protein [Planctomycetota bacterium]RLS91272.1 MAG: sulfite exporter TauE/SafE family protein [Planctomycetota bacterium]